MTEFCGHHYNVEYEQSGAIILNTDRVELVSPYCMFIKLEILS
jgi:hypothetical protein